MSHVALRRVVIRLLHDANFVAMLASDPDSALRGVTLTRAERGALLAVPLAAWRTDLERAGRVLQALREEFPATVTLAGTPGPAFLASRDFHRAIQERGSLALAFGTFLQRTSTPLVREIARLETAIAQVRRAPRRPTPSAPGHVRLSPRAAVVVGATGATACLEAIREGRPIGKLGTTSEAHLVIRSPDSFEVTIEHLESGVCAMIEAAQSPCEVRTMLRVATDLGASPEEAKRVIQGLCDDELLV